MAFKILLVDDDPDVRDLVSLILESQDYEVITASDGAQCLARLERQPPALLILDLLMPVLDGFAVCRELAGGRRPGIREMPVLILTSVREDASRGRYERETGNALKVAGFVEKPFSPGALIQAIRRALGPAAGDSVL